jgi:PBSX family phage terminase large subunit
MTIMEQMPMSARQARSIGESTAKINIWEGAVRSGKTVASLLKWLIYVATAPTTGELIMVGKTTHTINRNVFAVLQDPALFGPIAKLVHYTPGAPTAGILGRTVHVIGANDSKSEPKIRGLTCAGAYVDEATLVPPIFWDQLLARMSVEGAQIFATTNPDNPAHWLRRDWLSNANAPLRSWKFRIDDNKFLPASYVADIKAMYAGLFYRRFILGEWVAAEGAIFDMWDPDRHTIDLLPIDRIQRWLGLGIDYGTANPFHAILLGLGTDRRLYAAAEWRYDSRHHQRQLTDSEYSERLRGWLGDVPRYGPIVPQRVIIDPSAASFKAQMHRDRMRPHAANNDVMDGIRTVSSLLAQRQLIIHSSCTALIDEITGYSWDDRAALLGEDKPIKVADHGVDALRYVTMTTRSLWQQYLALAA